MRKGSIKNNRLSSEVRRELSEIVNYELKDPRISGMVTLTDVYVAPDLKTCKAYVSVLGDKEALDKTIEGLKSSAGFVRRELAHRMNLRNTPEITFVGDESIAYGVSMTHRIDELIAQIPDRSEEEAEASEASDSDKEAEAGD